MGAFLKQAFSLIAGQMAGSNNKAKFVVKTFRAGYILSAGTIGVAWYSAYRNERVQPGTGKIPFPFISKLKREYPADRPEHELPHEESASNAQGPAGPSGPVGLQGTASGLQSPFVLTKGISKANELSGKYPYVWGGGHAQIGVPTHGGYDCSGAVSAVLGAMGLLSVPLVSGDLAHWGVAGPGKFITIYANQIHTFMKININGKWQWFGTGSDKEAIRGGPAWGNHDPELGAYQVRHPLGY
jgi:hypothetical protein